MNRIFLPFQTHLSTSVAAVGWVRSPASYGLSQIAEDIKRHIDGTAGALSAEKDHAIPSPVAHIMHFKKRLESKEPDLDAINEWRGMLAAIIMRDNTGADYEKRLRKSTH